jgi:hypothetical protein
MFLSKLVVFSEVCNITDVLCDVLHCVFIFCIELTFDDVYFRW